MKRILIPTTFVLLSMLLCIGAFAKAKSTEIDLYRASQVAGTTLQPGTYKVAVNPSGSTAQVTFVQNGKQMASVTGQLVQLAKKSDTTSVTMDTSSAVPAISQIDFEGSQTAVSFSSASNSAAGE